MGRKMYLDLRKIRNCRLSLKCDSTRAETGFHLSAKQTSPFISAWAEFQSTTGSRGGRISGSNAGYTMFRGSVKDTGYPLHSPISPSLPLPCVTVCHQVSTGLYLPDTKHAYGLRHRVPSRFNWTLPVRYETRIRTASPCASTFQMDSTCPIRNTHTD
jgi:hypothetical protein